MNNFSIGIPTINRWDLLKESVQRYVHDFPNTDIHIYDNGKQDIPEQINGKDIFVYGGEGKNIGVAGAWNFLLDRIFESGKEYGIVLNDDIYLGRTEYQMGEFIRSNRYDLYVNPIDWCIFIMPKPTFDTVGRFDEAFFPAYCEDIDYHYRCRLMVKSYQRFPFLLPAVHRNSQTLEKDPKQFHKAFHNNKEYYKKKWGGYPEEETFKIPFNGNKL